MIRIKLTEAHRKSLSSTINVIERTMDELKGMIEHTPQEITYTVETNISEEDKQHALFKIVEIKQLLERLVYKYDVEIEHNNLKRLIEVRKSTLWEVIADTYSDKASAYGDFHPEEYSKEYDEDLSKLSKLIQQI